MREWNQDLWLPPFRWKSGAGGTPVRLKAEALESLLERWRQPDGENGSRSWWAIVGACACVAGCSVAAHTRVQTPAALAAAGRAERRRPARADEAREFRASAVKVDITPQTPAVAHGLRRAAVGRRPRQHLPPRRRVRYRRRAVLSDLERSLPLLADVLRHRHARAAEGNGDRSEARPVERHAQPCGAGGRAAGHVQGAARALGPRIRPRLHELRDQGAHRRGAHRAREARARAHCLRQRACRWRTSTAARRTWTAGCRSG